MSLRPRSEAALISALINNGDSMAAERLGARPDMFVAKQAEYRWLLDYQKLHGKCATQEAIERKFPGFIFHPEKIDISLYVEELIYDHNQRQLHRTIRDAAALASEGDLDEAILRLGAYSPHSMTKPLPNALHHDAFLDDYHEPIDVLHMPWFTLQDITGGMRSGELWYIAARLGQGKSWTMTSMIGQALMDGRNVLMYSLEMPEAQVLTRLHVWLGQQLGFDVDHIAMRNRIYDVIAYRKLLGAIKETVPGQLYVHDTSKGVISPGTLQGGQNKEVDLVMVDHAGLMHLPNGGRAIDDWRSMATISNMLKEVALGQGLRVVSAAQINREGDREGHKWPPKVKHLAQSDALGQDADVVITHRRWGRTTMCYSIEKTRDGYSEVPFWTTFEPNVGRFKEIYRDMAEDRWEREKEND